MRYDNQFFMILREDIDDGKIEYFNGFLSKYDVERKLETIGLEIWSEMSYDGRHFDTMTEASQWLKAIVKDDAKYSYQISLYRIPIECDKSERGELCDDVIQLKVFFDSRDR